MGEASQSFSTVKSTNCWKPLMALVWTYSHLLQKVACQDPVVINLDRGIRSLKQADFIPIASLPQMLMKEGVFSRTSEKSCMFTHGAPKWSKLSGIESENVCHSYIRTEFSLALICGNVIYLLDSSTYARQWMHDFKQPILEFTSYNSKILIVIGTTDRMKATLYLLDTFDQTFEEIQVLFQGWLKGGSLKTMYLELWSNQPHLLFYESLRFKPKSRLMPYNNEIIMVPIDMNNSQKPKTSRVVVKLTELRTAEGVPLIACPDQKVTILEVSNFGYKLFVFYEQPEDKQIRGLIVDSSVQSDKLEFLVNQTEPISFINTSFPQKYLLNRTVWGIPRTTFFMFYQVHFGELIICSISLGGDEWKVTSCSNPYKMVYNDVAPNTYMMHGFNRLLYNQQAGTWFIHLEVKSRDADNRTLYSSLLEFNEETLSLKEITYWNVGSSKYHYLLTSGAAGDIKRYELVALKRHGFQAYKTTMEKIRINYEELNKSRKAKVVGGRTEVVFNFSYSNVTGTNIQGRSYVLNMKVKLMEKYSGLIVSSGNEEVPLPLEIRSADRISLPLSELKILGTNLLYGFDHIIKEQRPIIKLQQDTILAGTLFSEKVDDLIQLDILPDRPIVDLRIQGSYLLLLSKWFPREQLTKGYLYWCDPDVFVSPSVATHTELSCLLLRSFTVGKEVLLKEVFDLNYFVVVQLQADNAVVYAKFDKIEFSCVVLEAKGYTPSKVLMAEHDINTVMMAQYRPNNFKSFTLFQMTGEQLVRLPDLPLAPFFSSSYGRFEVPYFGLWATRDGVVLQLIMNYTTSLSQATFGLSPGQVPTRKSLHSDLLSSSSPVDLCVFPDKIAFARASATSVSESGPDHQSTVTYIVRVWIFNPTDTEVEKFYKFPEQLHEIDGITGILELSCVPSLDLVYLRLSRQTVTPDSYKISNVFISADIDGQATNSILSIITEEGKYSGAHSESKPLIDCRVDWAINHAFKICFNNSASDSGYFRKNGINFDAPASLTSEGSYDLTAWRIESPRVIMEAHDFTTTSTVVIRVNAASHNQTVHKTVALTHFPSQSLIRSVRFGKGVLKKFQQLSQGNLTDFRVNLLDSDVLQTVVDLGRGRQTSLQKFGEELHHLHFALVKKTNKSSSNIHCYTCQPTYSEIFDFVKIRPRLEHLGNLLKPNIWGPGILDLNSVVQLDNLLFLLSSFSRDHQVGSRISVVQIMDTIPVDMNNEDLKESNFGLEKLYERDIPGYFCGTMDADQTPLKSDGTLYIAEIACIVKATTERESYYEWVHLEFVRTSDGKLTLLKPLRVVRKNPRLTGWHSELLSLQVGFSRIEQLRPSIFFSDYLCGISLSEYEGGVYIISFVPIAGLAGMFSQGPILPQSVELKDWGPKRMKTVRMLNFFDPLTKSNTDIVFIALGEDSRIYFSNQSLYFGSLMRATNLKSIDWQFTKENMDYHRFNCTEHKIRLNGRETIHCFAEWVKAPHIHLYQVSVATSNNTRSVTVEFHSSYELPHNFTVIKTNFVSATFLTVDGVLHLGSQHLRMQLYYDIQVPADPNTRDPYGVWTSLLKTFSMEHYYSPTSLNVPKLTPDTLIDFEDELVAVAYDVRYDRNHSRHRLLLSSSDGTLNVANVYAVHSDATLSVNASRRDGSVVDAKHLAKLLSEYELQVNFGFGAELLVVTPDAPAEHTLLKAAVILAVIMGSICVGTCLVYWKVRRNAKMRGDRESVAASEISDSFYYKWPKEYKRHD